ncbi:DUF6522 family protein [Metarhizobium album]|uniref:DUF6522 family protein n=1 Tax=Metarhizobium album TaxID=2182425 RepID=UPI001FDECF7F|nr:DUF6522 family protein [Rhizobium album]
MKPSQYETETIIDIDETGAVTLSADMLAGRFGWSPATLRTMMQRGLVASQVERGEGEHHGSWRLSVRCGNRRWRAVVGPDGSIADQQLDFVPLPRKQPVP